MPYVRLKYLSFFFEFTRLLCAFMYMYFHTFPLVFGTFFVAMESTQESQITRCDAKCVIRDQLWFDPIPVTAFYFSLFSLYSSFPLVSNARHKTGNHLRNFKPTEKKIVIKLKNQRDSSSMSNHKHTCPFTEATDEPLIDKLETTKNEQKKKNTNNSSN